jgi:rhomboid protease GluP
MNHWIKKITFYANRYPVTTSVTVLNLLIFIGNNSGAFLPVIAYPGALDLYSFFAHFSHLDLIHIGFNLLILWKIGPLVEQRLGAPKFTILILLLWSGLVTGGFFLLQHPSLGFSGIGLGLLAYTGILYRHDRVFSQTILKWVAFNVLIGLLPQISFLMHFLGSALGLVLGFIIHPDYEAERIKKKFEEHEMFL